MANSILLDVFKFLNIYLISSLSISLSLFLFLSLIYESHCVVAKVGTFSSRMYHDIGIFDFELT